MLVLQAVLPPNTTAEQRIGMQAKGAADDDPRAHTAEALTHHV